MSRKVVEIKFAARSAAMDRATPDLTNAPDQWVSAGSSYSAEPAEPIDPSAVILGPAGVIPLKPRPSRNRRDIAVLPATAKRSPELVCELHPLRQSFRAFTAVAESNLVLILGLQDVRREWMSIARAAFMRNVDAAGQLLACRSPQSAFDLQTGLARDHLEDGASALARLGRLSVEVADEASRVLAA